MPQHLDLARGGGRQLLRVGALAGRPLGAGHRHRAEHLHRRHRAQRRRGQAAEVRREGPVVAGQVVGAGAQRQPAGPVDVVPPAHVEVAHRGDRLVHPVRRRGHPGGAQHPGEADQGPGQLVGGAGTRPYRLLSSPGRRPLGQPLGHPVLVLAVLHERAQAGGRPVQLGRAERPGAQREQRLGPVQRLGHARAA